MPRMAVLNLRGVCVGWAYAIALAGTLAVQPLSAQPAASCPAPDVPRKRLLVVGSAPDDSGHTGLLIGACWGDASLIRSSVSLNDDVIEPPGRYLAFLIDPVTSTSWNSAIPFSWNDGAQWAGKGWSSSVMVGGVFAHRNLRVVVAPQFLTSANAAFPMLPARNPLRTAFASPWHSGAVSADIPLRFGDQRYSRVDPGETSVELIRRGLAIGATSASMWWGPGTRNALVMSNNAPGVPQVYVRTRRPLQTEWGAVEAHWLLGGLLESPFFDADVRNDLRSLSAAVVTLRLAADTDVTVGVTRAVYARARRFGRLPGHWADVFLDWHQSPNSGPVNRPGDQLTSLFARWVIPDAGLEAHVEWAKQRLPSSFRELLVDPERGQGFTLGLDWARSFSVNTLLKIGSEVTMLEQTPTIPGAEVGEFYASHSVPQGYTQQGQVIGAAIGPGSSSQHLGVDVIHEQWQVGLNVGRVRWEDDAYYRSPASFTKFGHDVSLYWGMSSRWDTSHLGVEASLIETRRMNYLFQTQSPFAWYNTGFDVSNTTVTLRLTAHR
jgi:hypothetical protein